MKIVRRPHVLLPSVVTAIAALVSLATAQDKSAPQVDWTRGSGFGVDCCSIPDLDSDGKPDVAVAAAEWGNLGAVHFISSKTLKIVRSVSGRPGTRMFGAAIAPIELPLNPRVNALAVTSQSSADGCQTYSIDLIDVANGKMLWPSALDVSRRDGSVGGRDVWMLPLAPAVVGREQREKRLLACTILLCVRAAKDTVELYWIDCAKRERTRSITCAHIPYRTNGHPLCAVGDVDGDGVEDLALMGEDRVLVFSAATGSRLLEIVVTKRPDLSSPTAACRGADYDGDGVPDILIGRPGAEEFVDWGDVSAYSSKTGKLLKRCLVDNRGSGFGSALLTRGNGDGQIVVVGKFAFLEDGVDVISASTLTRIASTRGAGGDYPEVGAQLFRGADFDGDGIVDLLVSRYDCKSPSEDVSGVILYSGKDYSLLGRIELGALRSSIK
jgi:hypothetical protein